jgi:hypothetical protein
MKIKMLASFAGPDVTLSPGDETERFSKDEAERLIKGGFAVQSITKKLERAVRKPAKETR